MLVSKCNILRNGLATFVHVLKHGTWVIWVSKYLRTHGLSIIIIRLSAALIIWMFRIIFNYSAPETQNSQVITSSVALHNRCKSQSSKKWIAYNHIHIFKYTEKVYIWSLLVIYTYSGVSKFWSPGAQTLSLAAHRFLSGALWQMRLCTVIRWKYHIKFCSNNKSLDQSIRQYQ